MDLKSPHFLLGEAHWFGSGVIPARMPYEISSPDPWSGWKRQRLKPAIVGLLFPAAWGVFFLVAGIIPILLDGMGSGIGVPLWLSLGMWVGSFILLWISAFFQAFNQIEGSMMKMALWIFIRVETILLCGLFWLVYSESGGWIDILSVSISIVIWLSNLVRIATLFAWPSGRWLLPIAHVDIGLSAIDEPWVSESKRWARRPLAHRHIKSGEVGPTSFVLNLYGVREDGQDYIALHVIHPSGYLLDPFVGPSVGNHSPFTRLGMIFADMPNSASLNESIGQPPVTPVVARWPDKMQFPWELEEE